ncbi:MAG: gamma-glutamyl-gamma-aminobutyrate hydrolase family protein, partial [Candidatus Methylomirabilota bacterium]
RPVFDPEAQTRRECVEGRKSGRWERLEVYRDYVRSVELAGGVPVLLPVVDDAGILEAQLDAVDGLVLVGGDDYSPELYGAKRHAKTEQLHPARQAYDLALAKAALRRGVPVLGICGGLQIINIVRGGDLIQHVPDAAGTRIAHQPSSQHDDTTRHDGEPETRNRKPGTGKLETRNLKLGPGSACTFAAARGGVGAPEHAVRVEAGTRLARIVGKQRLSVNSSHHQAVGRVGEGLRVSARSADGVIEGIEGTGRRFLVCVQWHPERLAAKRAEQLAFFRALVSAAGTKRRRKTN